MAGIATAHGHGDDGAAKRRRVRRVAGIMLAGTAMHAAPWILYRRLFRKSRYP